MEFNKWQNQIVVWGIPFFCTADFLSNFMKDCLAVIRLENKHAIQSDHQINKIFVSNEPAMDEKRFHYLSTH